MNILFLQYCYNMVWLLFSILLYIKYIMILLYILLIIQIKITTYFQTSIYQSLIIH